MTFIFQELWSSQLLNQILKIQCQYLLLKVVKYFWWISYETYCLKVSLSKKLTFTIFSKRNHNFFLFMKTKTKIEKHKRKKPTYSLSPPHLFQKNVLDGLILGRKQKIFWLLAQSGHMSKFIFFNFIKYKSACTILL